MSRDSYSGQGNRRRVEIPKNPGNYPGDYLFKVRKALKKHKNGEPVKPLYDEILTPLEHRGVLLAADIRNYTKTLEEHKSHKVRIILNDFFSAASDIISKSDSGDAFINKYLGDALFAHIPNGDAGKIIDAAKNLIITFNGLKKGAKFRFANLSVAITKTDYVIGPIGGLSYTDYTLVGPEVNSLFRMLSRTGGGMIWVTKLISQETRDSHFHVYLGELNFKGIVPSVSTYSIIRNKNKNEDIYTANTKCNVKCDNYHLCKSAWEIGREHSLNEKRNKYIFNLDCNKCGKDNSKCWLWDQCKPKYKNINDNKIIRCCYMCKNFRNCFHNYQLGRMGNPMISCDMDFYENFIIDSSID